MSRSCCFSLVTATSVPSIRVGNYEEDREGMVAVYSYAFAFFFFFLRGCITILNKSSRHGASYLLSERWINVLCDESPASEKYQIYGRVACANAPTLFIAP